MFFSDIPLSTFALLMLPAIINLWGISHAMRHVFPGENERALWVAACIFLPILGGVLYLVFGLRRSKNIATNDTSDTVDNDNTSDNIANSENDNNQNNQNGE